MRERIDLNQPEPRPEQSEGPAMWDRVIAFMQGRDDFGQKKYGRRLHAFDGRNSLVDLIQELADALVYATKKVYEEDQERAELERIYTLCVSNGPLDSIAVADIATTIQWILSRRGPPKTGEET